MQTMSPPPSSPPVQHEVFSAPVDRSPVSMRSLYTRQARTLHPDLIPQNDFEILALGSNILKKCKTTEAKRAWLREELASTIAVYGSLEATEHGIKGYLDAMVEPSGVRQMRDVILFLV